MNQQFLLDTNVVSEPTRPRSDAGVERWLRAQSNESLHVSAITIGELRKGLALLAPSERRSSLERWFEQELLAKLSGRILPVTQTVADRWGVLTATRQQAGDPLALADGLIAATALEHDLVLVTRNTKHFSGLNLPLLNPWETQPRIT